MFRLTVEKEYVWEGEEAERCDKQSKTQALTSYPLTMFLFLRTSCLVVWLHTLIVPHVIVDWNLHAMHTKNVLMER